MSIDYWWFFIHLSSEEENEILSFYQHALQKAILSDSSKDILQQWRNNPETFINYQDNNWFLSYNSFISAFIIPSFQNFGEQLLSGKLIQKSNPKVLRLLHDLHFGGLFNRT